MVNVIGEGLEGIRNFISRCLAAGGVPIFKTKYGGKRFGDNSVVAACWRKGKEVPGGTIVNVPPDIIAEMEKRTGDWKWLAQRLGISYT